MHLFGHVVKVGYWKCAIESSGTDESIHYAKAFGKEGHGINVSTSVGHLRRRRWDTSLSLVQQTEASRRLFALSASVFLRNRIPWWDAWFLIVANSEWSGIVRERPAAARPNPFLKWKSVGKKELRLIALRAAQCVDGPGLRLGIRDAPPGKILWGLFYDYAASICQFKANVWEISMLANEDYLLLLYFYRKCVQKLKPQRKAFSSFLGIFLNFLIQQTMDQY